MAYINGKEVLFSAKINITEGDSQESYDHGYNDGYTTGYNEGYDKGEYDGSEALAKELLEGKW